MLTESAFHEYGKQGYNHVPLSREILGDLDTPLSVYLKLTRRGSSADSATNSYLLESVHGGEKWGRYSIIGLPGSRVIEARGAQVLLREGTRILQQFDTTDPFAVIEQIHRGIRVPVLPDLPRFSGGMVGYWSYDCVRYAETKLARSSPPDELGTPDIYLILSNDLVVVDNLSGRLRFIHHADPRESGSYERGIARLEEIERNLREPYAEPVLHVESAPTVDESDFKSRFGRDGFKQAVNRIREYILDGDVMQTVLSQRMSIPFRAQSIDLYRALRCLNPSPYMYYLQLDGFEVVGSSPEILARAEDGLVTVRPIAGTRPRGETEAEDRSLEEELLADPKELAEHLMLIDLGRNDTGRVSETGSVRLTEKMVIERYSHVMHIVSNVTGRIRKDLGALDVLRATLPAGTLSGAPKVRAMEIIDELEPVRRGIYGGAVGYYAWNGNMDTAIAIRTAIIAEGALHIQAGAGIVADSDAESEWQETLNKGRAMFRAVAMAQQGLGAR